jgi:hypothetical protein
MSWLFHILGYRGIRSIFLLNEIELALKVKTLEYVAGAQIR